MYLSSSNWPRLLCGVALLTAQALAGAAAPDRDALREQFKQAYQAMAAGQVGKAEQLAAGLEYYPLYPYLRYEYLHRRLHRVKSEQVREFLAANEHSVVGDRLRTKWLQHLARRQRWQTFIEDYRPQSDTKLQCTHLLARIKTGATEGIAQDALRLWLVGESQPEECDPAFKLLYASPLMNAERVWQRIRLAMEAGETRLALWLAGKLPPNEQRLVRCWYDARRNPAAALRLGALREDNANTREIVAYAIKRLARRDTARAVTTWEQLRDDYAYTALERAELEKALAVYAALEDDDLAPTLLDAVADELVDAEVQRARLRTAIRTGDWAALVRWTRQEAAADMNEPRWRYWRARALEETGDSESAIAIYRRLSQERDYYGFRAADRLGVGYAMSDRPLRFTEVELEALRSRAGIARALEFYALNYIYSARREWLYETADMNARQLEQAAVVAHEVGWHDRAVFALAHAESYDDLTLRFPMPFESLVMKYAKKRDLPAALIFSIMRAESAFTVDARSPAGALGLMQVMPTTGHETAKQIGYKLTSAKSLLQARPNVTLGSAYLKGMLDRFSGNIAMAAAAYNAGPHRVRSWQPEQHCLAAEDWIELVPFTETRRYVRRALFYTAIYEWRLAQRVQPLQVRLTAVPSRQSRSVASC